MRKLKHLFQRVLPRPLYRALLAPYHLAWALGSALYYRFPAKRLVVIGVTGTKGKSSVTEMITAILKGAEHTVAVSSTIHFSTGMRDVPNLYKMTLPGRGFIQKLLREAVDTGATHAVIELTSEAALQYRHFFLYLDVLVFTNLEPEHIESHGSMEAYFRAKFRLGQSLVRSSKRPRAIIANADSPYGERFLALRVEKRIPFSLREAEGLQTTEAGIQFMFDATTISIPHPGDFSARNALASLHMAMFLGISAAAAAASLKALTRIKGRAERIEAGQPFLAVVDYAHTPDSLEALYRAYAGKRKICVLGNAGGGRDTWKRPLMGSIAETYCEEVILTDEDPYDEDPQAIVEAMQTDMKRTPRVIMDRREAIRTGLSLARPGDVVLVTGKGTDPYIMGPRGAKLAWSDAHVVREALVELNQEV